MLNVADSPSFYLNLMNDDVDYHCMTAIVVDMMTKATQHAAAAVVVVVVVVYICLFQVRLFLE